MLDSFDYAVIQRSLQYTLGEGMRFTIELTAIASAGGIVLGTVIAMARLSNIALLAALAKTYVNLFRALPLVLVIFLFYFLSPFVCQWMTGAPRPVLIGAKTSAIVTFTLFEAAYFAEIMRAGIQSVPRLQYAAAQALGLTYWQSMANVILPQAFRNMLPVLFTQTIVLFQDTSLVYVLSISDFLGANIKIAQREGRIVEMYVFATLVYFTISFAASRTVMLLQKRVQIVR